ncbi:MAG: respiratory chain complex I subunit 1 family protein [Cuniculiplasma sp.]|jgi:formate hydrogenlyase subunit 4
MMQVIFESVVQVLGILLFSPLIAGIYENIKAKTEFRKGSPILQPYYDLAKNLRKEAIISRDSGFIHRKAPMMVLSIMILLAFLIPVQPGYTIFAPLADFLGGAMLFTLASVLSILGAIDNNSNFTAMSAGRSVIFSALVEPTLIVVFFAVAIETGTNNPYITNADLTANSYLFFSLTHILASLAFLMFFMFETGKLPVEGGGLSELGMIEEGKIYEYGGRNLFFIRYSSIIKQYLLGSLFLNVFIFPWGLQPGFLGSIIDIPIMLVKWLVLILLIIILEQSIARIRIFKIVDFLSLSFILSFLSVTLFVVGGFS